MSPAELSVWGVHAEGENPCVMDSKETSNDTDFFYCDVQSTTDIHFEQIKVNLSVILKGHMKK